MKSSRIIILTGLWLALLSPARGQTSNFLAWTFDNLAVAVNNLPAPSLGSGTATPLGMSNSYNSTTSVTTADVLSDPGSSTGTAGPNAWRVRGQSPGNGWSSQAPIGTQGAEFAGSTVGFSSIKVTFDLHTTSASEANLAVFYTTNGGTTWSNANLLTYSGSGAAIKTNSTSTNTVIGTYIQFQNTNAPWYNGLVADLSGIAAVNSNANFAVKLVNASKGADDVNQAGTAYNNSSGNWRYDNVIFSGIPGSGPLTVSPSVSLTSPQNGLVFNAPASFALAASATEAGGSVSNVAFYQGATKLVAVSTPPYTDTWSGVAAGSYALTAVATDNHGVSATSSVVNVTVTNAAIPAVLQPIRTVFVIALENHNFVEPSSESSPQEIFGNPAAPYVNSLITPGNPNAAQVSYATNYYNVGVGVHGSEPNYIWSEAGSDYGVHTDSDPSSSAGNVFTVSHLTGLMNAAGISWKDYQEDMQYSSSPLITASGSGAPVNPYNGSTEYFYAVKHNPMAFFSDTQTQNVYTLATFVSDLTNNTVGRYNWITPDELNEMHTPLTDGFTYHGVAYSGDQSAIAQGDNFLSQMVPLIMSSAAYKSNGVIILWWDETEGGDTPSYPIPEIIISPLAKGNAYASPLVYSHASDLKTMEELFGFSLLTNSIPSSETTVFGTGYNSLATVNDLSDMFAGIPRLNVQLSGAALVSGGSTLTWGTVNVGSNITQTLTVTNAGSATLVLSNMVVTGPNADDFSVSGITLPASIAAGASATFHVEFAPTACGTRSATLPIGDNDSLNNPFQIALTGIGNMSPVIVSQPDSVTNLAGSTATFSVGATGCTPLNYQWYFATNVLMGATNSLLTIAPVGPANAGNYSVVVNGSGGSTNSISATLNVFYQVPNIMGGAPLFGSGGVQLTFAGPTGQTYQVLASDDLTLPKTNWTVVGTGAFGLSNAIFTDMAATNYPHRFYIIKSP